MSRPRCVGVRAGLDSSTAGTSRWDRAGGVEAAARRRSALGVDSSDLGSPAQQRFVSGHQRRIVSNGRGCYEAIGGVNFRKGCYPGQEIVARSQYLGKQKRRTLPATVAAERVAAGMEVFSSADPGQPCGMVVNAEPSGQGRFDCLVETKTAALEGGSVHLGAPDGPALAFGALPYSLAEPA